MPRQRAARAAKRAEAAPSAPAPRSEHPILGLQRTIGNQAVQRLISGDAGMLQRAAVKDSYTVSLTGGFKGAHQAPTESGAKNKSVARANSAGRALNNTVMKGSVTGVQSAIGDADSGDWQYQGDRSDYGYQKVTASYWGITMATNGDKNIVRSIEEVNDGTVWVKGYVNNKPGGGKTFSVSGIDSVE